MAAELYTLSGFCRCPENDRGFPEKIVRAEQTDEETKREGPEYKE